jgi:hypothetical protein
MPNRAPAVVCCANTPSTRAQPGALSASVVNAFIATRSAVMSPTSSIATARDASVAATRNRACRSRSTVRAVCNVANNAISASGNNAALRISISFTPVGARRNAAAGVGVSLFMEADVATRTTAISAC